MDYKLMKLAQDALTFEKQFCIGAGAIEEVSRIVRESTVTSTLSRVMGEASRAARESMATSGLLTLEDSRIRLLLKTIDQSKELERVALGPFVDLERMRSLIPDLESPLQLEMERMRQSMAALGAPRFLLLKYRKPHV